MSSPDDRLKRFLSESHAAPRDSRMGKYRLLRKIARGGFADVYEAKDAKLHRRVALKVIRVEEAEAPTLARLQREAAIAAQLQHPNIVAVHEAGMVRDREGRLVHYIAMDFVDGRTMAELLRDGHPDLLRMLEDVARAADYAHSKGVVHRDLKPSNVLVEKGGRVLLTDFGVAHLDRFRTRLTQTNDVLGTPHYMAPEQVLGRPKEIGPRTDVYALGVILYEILTGHPPHRSESVAELFQKIVTEDPPRPRGVPPDLEVICLKAMEKDPAHRYASAREFADELARVRNQEPIRARPISGLTRLWRRARKYRAVVVPSAIAAASLLALAVWAVVGSARHSSRIRQRLADGWMWERENNVEASRDAYRSVLELDPEHPEAQAGLARMDGELRRRSEAKRLAEAGSRAIERGWRNGAPTELDEGERLLREALTLDPTLMNAHYMLARALHGRDDPEEAIAKYGDALRLDPEHRMACFYRASLLLKTEDWEGAIRDYTQVIRLDPTNAQAYNGRGDASRQKGDPASAIADYTEAIRLQPNLPQGYAHRGFAHEDRGQWAEAKEDLQHALTLPGVGPTMRQNIERRLEAVARKESRQ